MLPSLLDALLDSWYRNNSILVNLLQAISPDDLGTKATGTSPSVAQMFMHMHYVRLVFLSEDVPEFPTEIPAAEWTGERDPTRIAQLLNQSAAAVHDALKMKLNSGTPMQVHYDHPILLLQHMIWHEGYHHGQIKLALKLAGHPLPDDQAGPLTWRVWMNKT